MVIKKEEKFFTPTKLGWYIFLSIAMTYAAEGDIFVLLGAFVAIAGVDYLRNYLVRFIKTKKLK